MHVVKELMLEKRIEPTRLFGGAGKTVQNKTVLAIHVAQAACDHVANQFVGYQVATIDNGLGLRPELGATLHVLPQDVAGRNLRNPVLLSNSLGLGAFSGSRWSEKNHRAHAPHRFCHVPPPWGPAFFIT